MVDFNEVNECLRIDKNLFGVNKKLPHIIQIFVYFSIPLIYFPIIDFFIGNICSKVFVIFRTNNFYRNLNKKCL